MAFKRQNHHACRYSTHNYLFIWLIKYIFDSLQGSRVRLSHTDDCLELDVMYVRAEDVGTYSVIARNPQGEAKSESKLNIETPTPHIPNPAQRPQNPTRNTSNGVLSPMNQNFKRPLSGNTQGRKVQKILSNKKPNCRLDSKSPNYCL